MRARVDLVVAAAASLLAVILLVAVWVEDEPSAKLEVFEGSTGFLLTSEPADALGSYPYLDLDQRRAAGAPAGEVAITADPEFGQVGTYAGTLADTCDVSVFLSHLTGDTDLARRWATAAGISTGDIAGFLDSLSASALIGGGLYEMHGDDDGVRTSESKRLDPGTAVLVGADGEPRVRCLDGNPLTGSTDAALANAAQPGGELLTGAP